MLREDASGDGRVFDGGANAQTLMGLSASMRRCREKAARQVPIAFDQIPVRAMRKCRKFGGQLTELTHRPWH